MYSNHNSIILVTLFLFTISSLPASFAPSELIQYRWGNTHLQGEFKISWTNNGYCAPTPGQAGRPVGEHSVVYDTPVVESIPMTRFVPGQTNAVPYGHYVDKKSFTWRAVTKSTGHRNGDCDSYAEAEFDLVQFDSHFDKKGIRKMRIRIRDMCTDSSCRKRRPNVDCLKGPAGQMVQYNGKWINTCFEVTS